jgi:hypothetical protein
MEEMKDGLHLEQKSRTKKRKRRKEKEQKQVNIRSCDRERKRELHHQPDMKQKKSCSWNCKKSKPEASGSTRTTMRKSSRRRGEEFCL